MYITESQNVPHRAIFFQQKEKTLQELPSFLHVLPLVYQISNIDAVNHNTNDNESMHKLYQLKNDLRLVCDCNSEQTMPEGKHSFFLFMQS